MRAPFAIVVNGLAVGKQWPPQTVKRGPALERHVINDERGKILGVRRASRQVYEIFHSRHRVGNRQRAGGIRTRSRNATESGTGSNRDRGGGTTANLASDVQR